MAFVCMVPNSLKEAVWRVLHTASGYLDAEQVQEVPQLHGSGQVHSGPQGQIGPQGHLVEFVMVILL